MVLDLGGGGLFNTADEERWKGISGNRIGQYESVAADADAEANLDNGWTATDASITINVKPDELVCVMMSCTGIQSAAADQIEVGIRRNANQIGRTVFIDAPLSTHSIPMATHCIDDPGEGDHVYAVYGRSSSGNGDLNNILISAFIIGVK